MRTSAPTTVEVAAFNKFAQDFDIIADGEVGVENANTLCNPIINNDSNPTITAQTLAASLLNVKNQIKFKSAAYKKGDELARQMTAEEQQIYRIWSKSQKFLVGIDGSEEGYQNVATLLGWFRGNAVTAHHLDLALGNVINNAQFGRIHFHPQPKADRSIVGGRLNHSLVNKSEEGFMPRSQTNRSARQIAEDNRPKVETVPTPVSINDQYQAKAEALQGRSHGQTDQARSSS